MKEADKRARITVAYGGLLLLRKQLSEDPNYKSTRAHLFALPKGTEKNPEIVKAVKTKDWQKDYLQRLIDAELLEKITENSQELYRALDIDEIGKIIEDHDNWGLRLSRFLFPREAGIPAELAEDEGEEEDESELPEPEPLAAKDSTDAFLQMSERSVETMIRLLNRIQEQLEMNTQLMKLTADQHIIVDKALTKSQEILEKESSQAKQEFPNFVKNRFKELEDRLTSIEESTSTGARTLTRLDAGLAALATAVGSIAPTVSQRIEDLARHYAKSLFEKVDQVGAVRAVISELRSKLSDLSAVEDLAMKVIDTVEKGEVTNER